VGGRGRRDVSPTVGSIREFVGWRARRIEIDVRAAVVLFTRDLRVHDQPALAEAASTAESVVPLFVLDDEIVRTFGAPNRLSFLSDALADLDRSLRDLGSALVVRRGDVVGECVAVASEVGASAVFVSEDVSAYAQQREDRLRRALGERRTALSAHPGVTVVPPGVLSPSGGGHRFMVFTPYWRRWRVEPRRAVLRPPERLTTSNAGGGADVLARLRDLLPAATAANLPRGGEAEGRRRLERWLRGGLKRYGMRRDDLALDATSGLSPYLHFGCLSPLEVAEKAARSKGAEAFVRQLCWRDFHHQLHAADPSISVRDLRPRRDSWRDDPGGLAAWKEGRTGYPIIDAGMRQLLAEGTMHNRARLLTASFLTKHLYIDWRLGAAHFGRHLVDGDVALNNGNWQWVAGTGADTRPNRVLNPIRQARRFDPDGAYVRRWVPELEPVQGTDVHQPWLVDPRLRRGYAEPIVDHDDALMRFRAARSATTSS
jgi:deoxyribodipyrimidine photo-lyase